MTAPAPPEDVDARLWAEQYRLRLLTQLTAEQTALWGDKFRTEARQWHG